MFSFLRFKLSKKRAFFKKNKKPITLLKEAFENIIIKVIQVIFNQY